ncbi:MAG: hypothetical protein KC618_05395 [Candidatus Omnitrophica bacterium]|nr:hypothetical protein [Candidatus Omnitrophota bacterium]
MGSVLRDLFLESNVMLSRIRKIVVAGAFVLTGCTATYVEKNIDPKTGIVNEEKYSKYYEAPTQRLFASVDVMAFAQVKYRPVLKNSLDRDASSAGHLDRVNIKVYFSNNTEFRYRFKVLAVGYESEGHSGIISNNSQEIILVPNSIERIEAVKDNVEQSAKEIRIDIYYQVGDQSQKKKSVILNRLTIEEAKKNSRFPFKF